MAAKRILVTGAAGSPGVNFIQSLQEAPEKIDIIAVDCNSYHLQWVNVKKRFLVPMCDHPEYIDCLNDIIEREGVDMVHPQPDVEVRAIGENRHRLMARTLLPSQGSIRILQDKNLSGQIWLKAGIRQNPTMPVAGWDDLVAAASSIGMPFWMRATQGAGARGSTLVENLETAYHWLRYWRARGSDWQFIAEEYLPGRDYAWQSLWMNGRLITSQGRERLEYIYPFLAPSGRTGTPTVARTVHNEEVNEIATRCVLAVDPHATGIFSVDLRENADGHPIPTEINAGRFFTTSLFFTRAGLNLPHLYLKLAFCEPYKEYPAYNPLPEGLHWIRHIDCVAALVPDEALLQEASWSPSTHAVAA